MTVHTRPPLASDVGISDVVATEVRPRLLEQAAALADEAAAQRDVAATAQETRERALARAHDYDQLEREMRRLAGLAATTQAEAAAAAALEASR